MDTLKELSFYCRIDKPIGALAFIGETGCGKTYFIEKELQDYLQDSHVIVRVSLFGISDVRLLHNAVKKQWISALMPLRSRKEKSAEQQEFWNNCVKAARAVVAVLNPKAGSLAAAAGDPLEYVVILPEVEDIHTKTKKKVILVFDDVDRTKLDRSELLGSINDDCENQGFNTIVVANKEAVVDIDPQTDQAIRDAKEKSISYVVYNYPDYGKIVHQVLEERTWKSEEYAAFLKEHEETILELFDGSEAKVQPEKLEKCHNVRSLIAALENFHRIYHHLTNAGVPDLEPYLCSFLSFYLADRSGIFKDGKRCYMVSDEEIGELYPRFSPENLFESVRQWIHSGYWNKERFQEELSRIAAPDSGQQE